ncbi:MAG: NPCBM/NEW2 domain-containing protein [Planctomycetota bacterium]|nr:NPCBM/NEW2 domain-containing protein [Planctomycetota bacterium]
MNALALTSLIALASPQDPFPGLVASSATSLALEALDGTIARRALEGLRLTDLRSEGAVFARYEGSSVPEPAGEVEATARIELHGGDHLAGWVVTGDEEGLEIAPASGASLTLRIEQVAALQFPGRVPTDGSATLRAPEEGDRLYVRRGRGVDQIDGVLLAFSEQGVLFEGRLGEQSYPWSDLAALFIEDLGSEPVDPPEVPIVVEIHGGGRLTGGLVTLDDRGVRMDRAGERVFLPASLVEEVAIEDGSYRFLSALPVADAGPVTLFGGDDDLGMTYPHRVDRSCMDGPLRCGGRSWSRGLGVHAPSKLTWKLDGAFTRLRAQTGVDDSALANRHGGSVIFRVHADGKELWASPLVRGGDPVQAIDLDLTGVDELVLEVDPASEAFVSDRANWLRPLLVGKR